MTAPAATRPPGTREGFVGREAELATLLRCLEPSGPRVVHVSGVAGIGKSSLLDAFAAAARDAGATVVPLDCSAIEPSVPGFLAALAEASGADDASLATVAGALGALGNPLILTFDTYELFWLMDTFIRRQLCPALPDHVRVVVAGRNGPVGAWLTSPEWRRRFQSITLGPLKGKEALACLAEAGLDGDSARRVNKIVRGHPLALRVAAGLGAGASGPAVEDAAAAAVVDHLTHEFLASITDMETRRALEAASVVRRVTESILGAMLPDLPASAAFERLAALPFTETRRDGLFVHDAVRDAVATRLSVARPERYRDLRVAAWHQLREEVKHATRANLWRYTADILYLLQTPVIREGFFPSGYQPLAVEAALPSDYDAIRDIATRHEGPEEVAAIEAWWDHAPEVFWVCRDAAGQTAGLFIVSKGDRLPEGVIVADPLAAAWRDDMLKQGAPERSLLLRRLLDREEGEANSGSRGAFGLDVKRTYMEMRPNLRYVYLAGVEEANLEWCDAVGFQGQPQLFRELDGSVYRTYRLDMGPGSVDAWLAGLVATELGIAPTRVGEITFDPTARELTLPSGAVSLTPLEAGVMAVLWERPGKPVSRAELLERVWGTSSDASSNVVDAVVVTLRKKLGAHAPALETVRSTGYRLRSEP